MVCLRRCKECVLCRLKIFPPKIWVNLSLFILYKRIHYRTKRQSDIGTQKCNACVNNRTPVNRLHFFSCCHGHHFPRTPKSTTTEKVTVRFVDFEANMFPRMYLVHFKSSLSAMTHNKTARGNSCDAVGLNKLSAIELDQFCRFRSSRPLTTWTL